MKTQPKEGEYRITERPTGYIVEKYSKAYCTSGGKTEEFYLWEELNKNGSDSGYVGNPCIYRTFEEAVIAIKTGFKERLRYLDINGNEIYSEQNQGNWS